MKTYILLSLASFTLVAFCQANRNDLGQPYEWQVEDNEFYRPQEHRKESINALSSRIQAFQQKLKTMEPKINPVLGGTGLQPLVPPVDGFQRAESAVAPYSVRPSRSSMIPVTPVDQENEQGGMNENHRGNVGVYVLPFIALQGASPFDWHSGSGAGPDFSIEQKLGFSSGWRIGKRWSNFFIDADVSYFRNKLKNMVGMPWEFSGTADGYGGMLNFGGNFNPGSSVSILFGAGVGAFNQEIKFKLYGVPEDEEATLFAYQVFSGINFYPTEKTLLSMKYRWLNIAEMEKFSARSLHMLELALGYVF